MRVLVVGAGGREHALCHRIAQSQSLTKLWCAPGNPGTAECAENVDISSDDLEGLLTFATEHEIDLTVVGPEAPLCAGLQDLFAEAGLLVFGPCRAAARLEGSKRFAKEVMEKAGVPTARFASFCREQLDQAIAYVEKHDDARVVKADGLAGGKGVIVCDDLAQTKAALRSLLDVEGGEVVVEQRLVGQEVSLLALCDGDRALLLSSSQDHKRLGDGDLGPNTGGMGAYSPVPFVDDALLVRAQRDVFDPVLAVMREAGAPFRGVLYAGLMIQDGTPYVLEFNCRFGDPETQPLMMRIDDDLLPFLQGAAQGALPGRGLRWRRQAAVCVVMASAGYPTSSTKGIPIAGLSVAPPPDVTVFHAATSPAGQGVVTAGGRVLGVTALGETVASARASAYQHVETLCWEGAQFRRDIAKQA